MEAKTKVKIKSEAVYDLAFYLIFFGLIGARVYAIFLDYDYYWHNPAQIIAIWRGGLAIHGAVIGGVIAAIIYCRKNNKSFWFWSDLAAPGLALAQAFVRWGNYFNQEVFGKPTNLPWGIPIEFANRPIQFLSNTYFHPTFLYESILNIINFIILFFLFRRFYFKNLAIEKLKSDQKIFNFFSNKSRLGIIFLVYLFNYSVIRYLLEFIRIDNTLFIFDWRWPQVLSLLIITFTATIFAIKYKVAWP